MQEVVFRDLGVMDYRAAWDMQEGLLQQNIDMKRQCRDAAGVIATDTPSIPRATPGYNSLDTQLPLPALLSTTNYLLLLEHPPVYTLGKSGKIENLLISREDMLEKGIAFYNTNRGGDITFHGPEQLIGYPVIDLEHFYTDIGRYLRNLEQVVIDTLAGFGIKGERSKGETGVWLEPEVPGRARKICAMGVRCSRWITMHGFALNINTNLAYFDHIIPCGIQGKQVTSLQRELGVKINMHQVKQHVVRHFENVFQVKMIIEGDIPTGSMPRPGRVQGNGQ
jgi:lipoyl(octanoyl) transferase